MSTRRLQVASLLRLLAPALVLALTLSYGGQPVQAADTAWRAEYFANTDLAGAPVYTRSDSDIYFDWGLGSPGGGIPVDRFSVRWTRAVYFPEGNWRFNVTVDDGVRMWVDGRLLIDQWRISAPATYSAALYLPAGDHNLRVEYFENTERAQIRAWWDQGGAPPPQPGGWRGEYFDNPDLAGSPRFLRNDASVNFDWGRSGPGGGIGADNYSVRWTRSLPFDAGKYQFIVRVDDGVRLWLDGNLLINRWQDSSATTYRREVDVGSGGHNLRVEYYQRGGGALIQLRWERADIQLVGNLLTCMRPSNSWIKVYRQRPDGSWEDLKPAGWGPLNQSGNIKIDGIRVDPAFGSAGQPLRVELYADGGVIQSVGNTAAGEPAFRLQSGQDLQTPWRCGAYLKHFVDKAP